MKKIYIFTAVLALLTLSLNAQLKAHKNGTAVPPKSSTEKVEKAPDGYFPTGPLRAGEVTPPYTCGFSETELDGWIYIDFNNDDSSWGLSSEQAQYHWNSSNAADDWLVSPGIYLQAGKTYKFYIDTKAESGYYAERLEVKMATAQDATQLSSGTTIIGSTNVNYTTYQTLSNENVTVSTDGTYYIGIHAISDANMYYLYVDNFFIDVEITDPTITTAQESISLTCAPGSSATQTVSVTGLNLTEGITASISGGSEFSVSPPSLGTSGGDLTITYSPTAVGTHTATITLSSDGAEDVTINVTGNCIAGTTYELVTDPSTQLVDGKKYILVGNTKYAMGALSGTNGYGTPVTITNNGDGTVTVPGNASAMVLTLHNYSSTYTSGYTFTLDNGSYLKPYSSSGTDLTTTTATSDNNCWITVADVKSTGGYGIKWNYLSTSRALSFRESSSVSARFAYYATSNITAGSAEYYYALLYVEKEEDATPVHDLSIALSAPASVVGGNTATVTATVTNTGNQTETGYTVTITDGTNNLLNQTATEPLAPGATATFTAEYNTTEAQVGTTVNFAANVACTDDADATNNSATASMQIITMPAPENVAVTTGSNQSATMTWDAPSIESTSQTVEWDFEEEADFNAFTIVDADGDNYNWYYSNSEDEVTHSGTGGVTSESYVNNASGSGGTALDPDNWLISPEITLGGNLSFWAAGQDPNYPSEKFAVYVCVGSYNGTSDFVKIGDYTATATMTEIPVDLSQYEGQGHFAIRHYGMTGNDMFRLNIDDISYSTREDAIFPVSYNIYLDGEFMGNVDANTFSYDFSNVASGGHTASVSAVYPGGIESAAVPAEFTILPTPNAPTVSSNDGTTSTTITITPDANTDGQLVYYVVYNGSQTQDLTFPRGANDYTVEVHAYTTATSNYNQSPEAVVPVTIPALPQTPAPTIAISSQTDDEVTITATGNGTVTLSIPGYEPVTGDGSASITVPRHMSDYVVTATATAQASGELVSTTTTENITVPGMSNDGWTQMTETYNNPNDLLSFKVKVGNDTTDIMMIDQFLAPTIYNDHPSSYTYVLKETKVINGVDSTMTSNPATVPVYKTNSTMRGLYTEAQVLADDYADEANRLTANAVNGEMDYDVVPDNNVLYYSLYRGGIQEETPVVDVDHRISQLQKFEDKVGDNVTYYFTENHTTGILPRYDYNDNIGSQTVERLDVDYVTGETGNQMSYVPVIWTFGLYTARGDGKNNSYGSDIKYNELGGVNVSSDIIVNWSDNNKMKVNGVDYYVVSPVITLDAVAPELVAANDGETYKYVPYMYRVWCTYTDAHNFGHVINSDGINYSLIETGLIDAPFCIGEVKADTLSNPSHVVIGRDLGHVSPQTQWSFAVTKEAVTNGDIKFVARYYYKKVVTEPASPDQPSGMRGNRDGGADYAIYEKSTSSSNIVTGVNELWSDYGKVVISQTYVNAQGMQSDKPFDGLNIVVTRFSDGTTTTTKVVR